MKILVAGAGGYIGIPLCEALASRGHEVLALDRYYFGKTPDLCRLIRADIRTFDPEILNGVECVIDLAGLSNDTSAEIDPELTRQINEEGGKRLATLAKEAGIRRYIYSSSASVYGHGAHHDLKETDPVNPLTAYARSKVAVEDHLRKIASDGFESVILRNATVFGVAPRMRFDLVANIMALTAWRDHQIIVRGGEQYRPMIHVRDVVQAFVNALDPQWNFRFANKTINIGYQNVTMNELARIVSNAAPWAKIIRVPDAVDRRDYHLSFDIYKTTTVFLTDIDVGVKEVIDALRGEQISGDDPTAYTLHFYRSLIEWEKRLDEIRLDGVIL